MNYDPIDTCPYDPVHRIMRSRMQYHLTKCAKNWPNVPKKQCPFDARHIINEIEFSYHISICPERESVWHYKIIENKEDPQPRILPIDSTPVAALTEENWEEDVKVGSYNPIKHTENKPVIRMLIGASKAERKIYQKQERLRLSRLEDELPKKGKDSTTKNNSNGQASSTIKTIIRKETSLDLDLEYKPLRRPKKLPLNASTMSDLNDSVATNTTIKENKSTQLVKAESSVAKDNTALQPRKAHSYAAALKQQQKSRIGSDVIENVIFDNDKENNSSFNNSTLDENLSEVSKTIQELSIGDKGHKAQSESLDKTLESLKKIEISKSAKKLINGINRSITKSTNSKNSKQVL